MVCCSSVNCSNRTEKGFRLFRFPTDIKRQSVWIHNMRRDTWKPNSGSRLCEVHFEESQFENNRADGWKKLKSNAIPTLFNVPNPPPRIEPLPRKSLVFRKCNISNMPKICFVKSCPSGRVSTKRVRRKGKKKSNDLTEVLSFFQPRSPERLEAWREILGDNLKPTDFVCHLHFKEQDIKLYETIVIDGVPLFFSMGKKNLKDNALPTVNHQFTSPSIELQEYNILNTQEDGSKVKVSTKSTKKQGRKHNKDRLLVEKQISSKNNKRVTLKAKRSRIGDKIDTEESIKSKTIKKSVEKDVPLMPELWLYVKRDEMFEFYRIDPETMQTKNHIRLNKDLSITVFFPNKDELLLSDKLNSFEDVYNYLKSVERWPVCVGTQLDRNRFSKKCRGVVIADEAYKRFQINPRCKACRILRNQLQNVVSTPSILKRRRAELEEQCLLEESTDKSSDLFDKLLELSAIEKSGEHETDIVPSLELKPKLSKVCRVCLIINRKMYNIHKADICEAYIEIVGPIVDIPGIEDTVCWECTHRLRSIIQFRQKVKMGLRMLLNIVRDGFSAEILEVKRSLIFKRRLIEKHVKPNYCDMYINEVVKSEDTDSEPNFSDDATDHNSIENNFDFIDKEYDNIDNDEYLEITADTNLIENETLDNNEEDTLINRDVEIEKELEEKVESVEVNKVDTKRIIKDVSEIRDAGRGKKEFNTDHYFGLNKEITSVIEVSIQDQMREFMRRKEKISYKQAAHKCETCYLGFDSEHRLQIHNQRHNEKFGPYECFICKKRQRSIHLQNRHLKLLHTYKYACRLCSFTTQLKSLARKHEERHISKKYKCPHCFRELASSSYLHHLKSQHVTNYVCELCGSGFVTQKGVNRHKGVIHRQSNLLQLPLKGPYCSTCDVRFLSKEAYQRHLHLSSKHSDDKHKKAKMSRLIKGKKRREPIKRTFQYKAAGESVTCEICSEEFEDIDKYGTHFDDKHPNVRRSILPMTRYICDQCGKIFRDNYYLQNHMWIHTGQKRYICDVCNAAFTSNNALKKHEVTHDDNYDIENKLSECPICEKKITSGNLKRHILGHTGDKPYKCEVCDKRFTTKGGHKRHTDHVHLRMPRPNKDKNK